MLRPNGRAFFGKSAGLGLSAWHSVSAEVVVPGSAAAGASGAPQPPRSQTPVATIVDLQMRAFR